MNGSTLIQIGHCVKRHMPTVLACLGAIGTVATAVLAVKATKKTAVLFEKAEEEKGSELTNKEKIEVAAPIYIPTATVVLSTIACIIGSNHLNRKQQAAMLSAYALLGGVYREYKNKAVDLFGEEADYKIEKALAQERESKDDAQPWGEPQIFYEEHLGQFFERTREEVFQAEYHFNRNLALRGYASLNEFYEFLGLPRSEAGEKLGWSLYVGETGYGYLWVDFEHRRFKMDDGLECTAIDMPFPPTADYLDG